MIRLLAAALAALLLTASAYGQSQTVRQSGSVTAGHATKWVAPGVVGDAGTAASGSLTSLGVTNEGGPGICLNSAAITTSYNALCLSASTSGPAEISLQNYGGATAQDLRFNVNGTILSLPTSVGGTLITGNSPFTVTNVPCFATTGGVIQDCGLSLASGVVTSGTWQATAIGLLYGGTGATSASGARTSLGLGTMSTQAASAVAITGGTITGMPSPSANSDVATKQYVDASAQGLIVMTPARLATAAVLPNTPTYGNGASGVGATLTAGANAAITVDGTVGVLNDRILVKTQASSFQNGLYTVTTVGDGSNPWVLTRATDFDTAAEMLAGSYFLATAGSANTGTSWVLQSNVTTVGTTGAVFNQFATAAAGVASIGGVTGAITLSDGLSMSSSVLTSSSLTNTRLAKTANYTVVNGDCGKTIALGGSAFFTLTLSSAATYTTACWYNVVNEDTGRGKLISPDGVTSFILWPRQSVLLNNQNSAWVPQYQPIRWKLTSNPTFRVDPLGSDSNDCLGTTTGACLTIQGAMNKVCANVDAGNVRVDISVASGTYTENVRLCDPVGTNMGGYDLSLTPRLVGNTATISCGANPCFTGVHSIAGWQIEGFTTAGSGISIYADANSHIYVGGNTLGTSGASAYDIVATYGGFAEVVGNITSTNNKAALIYSTVTGSQVIVIGGVNIHFNTVTYSQALVFGSMNSVVTLLGTYSGSTTQPASSCLILTNGAGVNHGGAGLTGLPCSTTATVVSPAWLN